MLIVRMFTDLFDVLAIYAFNVEVVKSSVPMFVVVLIIPALFALYYLWKRIVEERKR